MLIMTEGNNMIIMTEGNNMIIMTEGNNRIITTEGNNMNTTTEETNMTTAPAYLAEFTHRVPDGTLIPAGEEYVVYNTWFNTFSLRTSNGEVVQLVANPCYTRKPIAAPLPTKSGSLVIAHTADDPTRRPFMLDRRDTWFGPLPEEGSTRWYSSDKLINPVPAKAVEDRP